MAGRIYFGLLLLAGASSFNPYPRDKSPGVEHSYGVWVVEIRHLHHHDDASIIHLGQYAALLAARVDADLRLSADLSDRLQDGGRPLRSLLAGAFSYTAETVATERTIDVAYRCMKPLVDHANSNTPITYGELGSKLGEAPWTFTAPLDYIWEEFCRPRSLPKLHIEVGAS